MGSPIAAAATGRESIDGWRAMMGFGSSELEDDVAAPESRVLGTDQISSSYAKERRWPSLFSTHKNNGNNNNNDDDDEESLELYITYMCEDIENKVKLKPPIKLYYNDEIDDDNSIDTLTLDAASEIEQEKLPQPKVEKYIVARMGQARKSGQNEIEKFVRTAEYACEMLTRAEKVDLAVEKTSCDERNATAASKRTDILAARTPMKLRKLAERAAAITRQDARALVHLLKHDPNETSLQDAFDAMIHAADIAQQWLSFAPIKRGYAVSRHASTSTDSVLQNNISQSNNKHTWTNWAPALPLAVKYETRLGDAFRRVDSALEHLDALRARLPISARSVRFASSADVYLRQPSPTHSEENPDYRASYSSHTAIFSADHNDDLESTKFPPHLIDDFLTDSAPLGVGVMSSEIFACRDRDGSLFLTSNYRVADDLLRDSGMDTLRLRQCGGVYNTSTANDSKEETAISKDCPAILATTTIYKSIDDPRHLALDEGDEIWAVSIDNHEYFFCVIADHSDRGLRYACHVVGVDDATLDGFSIFFRRVE
eukprot:CAMPEP_0197309238 /NCGR_PEP_ID=MMETSP0891-20130614/7797_1 /TAXON_ID=44058 ORGANISM="Aureoumbra lagunensis, Strain CCMP1510" /NCGR_SAMPLE_ID=MMETSP0891 /ASSEMBLY_ACC=CAM_ASM_000534 /LENGTH=542 /DNA_ID=CAMNT_0042794187 /DNA_START=93 /DNA_END=1721 /DNA_ORIENTATION=-